MKTIFSCDDRTRIPAFGSANPPAVANFGVSPFYFNTSTKKLYVLVGGSVRQVTGSSGGTTEPPITPGALVAATNSLKLGSSEYERVYGPGVYRMDGLYNADVKRAGGYDYIAAHRFRATQNSALMYHRQYWSAGAGYAGGDGGDIRARVFETLSNGEPNMTGTVYGTFTYSPRTNGMTGGSYPGGAQGFYQNQFGSQIPLTNDRIYTIVYDNLNSNPAVNWSSVDNNCSMAGNGRVNRFLLPSDWAALVATRTAGGSGAWTWSDRTTNTYTNSVDNNPRYWAPILQLTYANGVVVGDSSMQTGNMTVSNTNIGAYRLSSGQIGREVFTFSSPATFVGLTLHIGCLAAGSLRMVLYSPAGQTAWSETKAFTPDTTFRRDGTSGSVQFAVMPFKDFLFPSPISFGTGDWAVDFEVQSGQFISYTEQNGSSYGFSWPAAFTRSTARVKTGSSFRTTNMWDLAGGGSTQDNWPIVLHRS